MYAEIRSVIRPSIPLAAWPAAGLWVGIAVAESVQWRSWCSGRDGLLFALSGAAAALLVALSLRRIPALALLCVGLAAGVVAGGLYWSRWATDVDATRLPYSGRIVVEAISDARPGAFGAIQEVKIRGGRLSGSRVKVRWPEESTPPEYGYLAKGYGRFKAPATDEWGRLAHRDGNRGALVLRLPEVLGPAPSLSGFVAPLRSRWHDRLQTLKGDGAGIVDGVVLGDRRRLADTPIDAALRTCGLTHLVAVSGGHLVIVAALVGAILRRTPMSARIAAVIVIVVCGLYVLASGVQPSAVRSFVMSVIACTAALSQRRGDPAAALAVTVAACLFVDPPIAFDLGFALSVLAVGGLVIYARLAEAWVAPCFPRPLRGLSGPVSMTLTAQSTTLPLTVPVFGMLSVIAPLANLVAASLISFALPVGLIGLVAGEVSPRVGTMLLKLSLLAASLCAWAADKLAALPGAAVPLGFRADVGALAVSAVLVALWVAWPQPRRGAAVSVALAGCLTTAIIVAGPRGPTGLQITVLDVGQGDAILLRDGNDSMLVDTGANETVLRQALARAGVRQLDSTLLTHGHADHAGALMALSGLVTVDEVVVSKSESDEGVLRDARSVAPLVRRATAGDTLMLGCTRLEVLWPKPGGIDPEGNDASLILLVSRGDFRCLLTGDAEASVLEQLVHDRTLGDIDVLKVGHHGSAEAVSPASMAVMTPEVALISAGRDNRFGHPTADTLDQLREAGVQTHRTDLSGDLIVEVVGDGRYRVR